jgi:hypothetical protein
MEALRQGWRRVIDCLMRDGLLSPEWSPDQAVDAAWAITSVSVWENLTVERGWSSSEYVTQMKTILKRILVKI